MKFGKLLLRECDERYQEYYIDYQLLKNSIKSYNNEDNISYEELRRITASFVGQLKMQIRTLNDFSIAYFAYILRTVIHSVSGESTQELVESLLLLQNYQQLNFTGIRKLGKKFDKKFALLFKKHKFTTSSRLLILDFAIKEPFMQLNFDIVMFLMSQIPKHPQTLNATPDTGSYETKNVVLAFPSNEAFRVKIACCLRSRMINSDSVYQWSEKNKGHLDKWSAKVTKEADLSKMQPGDSPPSLPHVTDCPKSVFFGFRKYPYLVSQVSIKGLQGRRNHSDEILSRRCQCDPLMFRRLTIYRSSDGQDFTTCMETDEGAGASCETILTSDSKDCHGRKFTNRGDAKSFLEAAKMYRMVGDLTIGKSSSFRCPDCPSEKDLLTFHEDLVFTPKEKFVHPLDRWDVDSVCNVGVCLYVGVDKCADCGYVLEGPRQDKNCARFESLLSFLYVVSSSGVQVPENPNISSN